MAGLHTELGGGCLRTKTGRLAVFPTKWQVGNLSFHFTRMFIHHTDSGLLFVSQARKGKVGGDGRGDAFNFVRLLLSASVTATKAAEL